MPSVSLEIKMPADVLSLMRKSRQEMEHQVQVWVATELFRRQTISAGRAAEMAGLSLGDFMDITRQAGIEWATYTEEELSIEIHEAIDLGKQIDQEGSPCTP